MKTPGGATAPPGVFTCRSPDEGISGTFRFDLRKSLRPSKAARAFHAAHLVLVLISLHDFVSIRTRLFSSLEFRLIILNHSVLYEHVVKVDVVDLLLASDDAALVIRLCLSLAERACLKLDRLLREIFVSLVAFQYLTCGTALNLRFCIEGERAVVALFSCSCVGVVVLFSSCIQQPVY